jgi:hypothetical protein
MPEFLVASEDRGKASPFGLPRKHRCGDGPLARIIRRYSGWNVAHYWQ